MTIPEAVKKYFSLTEADYFLYNFACTLCSREFEPDTSQWELYCHLRDCHSTLDMFK